MLSLAIELRRFGWRPIAGRFIK